MPKDVFHTSLTLSDTAWSAQHMDQQRGAAPPSGLGADLVCRIDEMDSSYDSVGIDVPESLLSRQRRSPSCRTILASP
jgi:hypothetical protein